MLVSNGNDILPPKAISISNNGVDYDEIILKSTIDSIENDISANGNLIIIYLAGGRNREINMADVTNQEGWTDDKAGTLQAIQDIGRWVEAKS